MTETTDYDYLSGLILIQLQYNLIRSLQGLSSYPQLVYMDLSHNNLTTIQSDDFWKRHTRLKYLLLNDNELSDLSEFKVLKASKIQLAMLTIHDNYYPKDYATKIHSYITTAGLDWLPV